MAWELEKKGVHMVVMWSVPYNLNIYNSYFAVGVVQLTTKFSRDMLPYWYFQYILGYFHIQNVKSSVSELATTLNLILDVLVKLNFVYLKTSGYSKNS